MAYCNQMGAHSQCNQQKIITLQTLYFNIILRFNTLYGPVFIDTRMFKESIDIWTVELEITRYLIEGELQVHQMPF